MKEEKANGVVLDKTEEEEREERLNKEMGFGVIGKELVDKHIKDNLCLTIEKELADNPELLIEKAKNFYPVNEEGERDYENGEYPDIYEFWSVSGWLAEKLEEKGEIVFECLDFIVWGRQTTGQAIYLDKVIQEIASENGF